MATNVVGSDDSFDENEVAGAKLDLQNLYKYSVDEFKFCLKCKNDSLKECTLKKDIISK